MKNNNVLTQLQAKRRENVLKVSEWPRVEIEEMLRTYIQAKEVAQEKADTESLLILDEKISQMREGISKKLKLAEVQP